MLADHLLKTKTEFKNFNKQDNQKIFIKSGEIKLPFNIIWLLELLNIYLEEQLQIKYYVIKHLIFLKFIVMMDSKEVYIPWFITFFDKKAAGAAVKNEFM